MLERFSSPEGRTRCEGPSSVTQVPELVLLQYPAGSCRQDTISCWAEPKCDAENARDFLHQEGLGARCRHSRCPFAFRNTNACSTPLGRSKPCSARKPRAAYHDGAVLGAAGDDLVVVGTPVYVQHRSCVPAHCWIGLVDPARLQGKTRKRAVRPQRPRAQSTGRCLLTLPRRFDIHGTSTSCASRGNKPLPGTGGATLEPSPAHEGSILCEARIYPAPVLLAEAGLSRRPFGRPHFREEGRQHERRAHTRKLWFSLRFTTAASNS